MEQLIDTDDYESGLGSLDGRDYFNSFVDKLAMEVHQRDNKTIEDPSFDLEHMDLAIRPATISGSNKTASSSSYNTNDSIINCSQTSKRSDLVLEEVQFLAKEIEKKSSYGQKLLSIMLKNLEKLLGPGIYENFLDGRLPANWIPIVRINNDNCPYIEFLIKSELADQDPESQLDNFTNNSLAYSDYIVKSVQNDAKKRRMMTTTRCLNNKTSTPRKNKTSTPLRSKTTITATSSKRTSAPLTDKPFQPDLNASLQRIQPNRSCKLHSLQTKRN